MRLVYPSEKYLNSYREFFNEYKSNNIVTYKLDDPDEVDVIKKSNDRRHGKNIKPNRVPKTTYWLVDRCEVVGQVVVRHKLNNDLLSYGGHISYCVKFGMWGNGVGTKMLAKALKKAREIGLDRVLITCDNDNFGSAKVIEKNGGVFENIVDNIIDEKPIKTKRYWINLTNCK